MTTASTPAPSGHSPTIDRRRLLAAVPALAASAAVPAFALAAPDRTAWNEAMRAYQSAKAEADAFYPAYNRVNEAWEAGRPSMDAIHWGEFPFANRDRIARSLDLDKAWSDFLDGEGKWWFARDAAERKDRHRAALDSVQAFRDAEAKHDRDSGMDDADAREEAVSRRFDDAETALMQMPAPDLAALRWKLDRVLHIDNDTVSPWGLSYVGQTLADYRRLLGEAA